MIKTIIGITSIFLFVTNISADTKYFAETQNNAIKRVIVAENKEWCEANLGGIWVETFMDNVDKNYAGIGYTYIPEKLDFHAPKLFNSWILDEKNKWKAPVNMPLDGGKYSWDEILQNWKKRP